MIPTDPTPSPSPAAERARQRTAILNSAKVVADLYFESDRTGRWGHEIIRLNAELSASEQTVAAQQRLLIQADDCLTMYGICSCMDKGTCHVCKTIEAIQATPPGTSCAAVVADLAGELAEAIHYAAARARVLRQDGNHVDADAIDALIAHARESAAPAASGASEATAAKFECASCGHPREIDSSRKCPSCGREAGCNRASGASEERK